MILAVLLTWTWIEPTVFILVVVAFTRLPSMSGHRTVTAPTSGPGSVPARSAPLTPRTPTAPSAIDCNVLIEHKQTDDIARCRLHGGGPFQRRRLGAGQLGAMPFGHHAFWAPNWAPDNWATHWALDNWAPNWVPDIWGPLPVRVKTCFG